MQRVRSITRAQSEYLLGEDYMLALMYEKGIEHLNKSTALDPTSQASYGLKGIGYFFMNNFDECIRESEKAIELLLKVNRKKTYAVAMIYKYLIHGYLQKNDLERAIYYTELYAKTKKLEVKCIKKYLVEIKRKRMELKGRNNVSGNEYLEAEMFKEAIKCFDKDIAENPNDMKGYFDKATALRNLRQFDECIGHCEKAIKIGNDVNMIAKCYYQMGLSYCKKDDIDKAVSFHKLSNGTVPSQEALEALSKMEKLQRTRKGIQYRQLAFQHENRGEIELAIENYSKAIEHDPSNYNYHFIRAHHYYFVGNYNACVEDCDQTFDIREHFSPIIYELKLMALTELILVKIEEATTS